MKNKTMIIAALAFFLVVGIVIVVMVASRPDQIVETPVAETPIEETPEPVQITPPADQIVMPEYESYLEDFLQNSGFRHQQTIINDYSFYELYAEDDTLAGFVLPGFGEGWGGPIFMFVKTDTAGVIKQVHVFQHSETPIYVVDLEGFLSTFAGFNAAEQLVWQNDIHGLTGATFTAEAVIAAVRNIGQKAQDKGIFH